jgi:hypothetical protein
MRHQPDNIVANGNDKPPITAASSCRTELMSAAHLFQTGNRSREASATPAGVRYYAAAMDKDDPTKSGTVFADDEIEPDA